MVLLYDGSFEGLLTCIFDAWKMKDREISIAPADNYTPTFLDQTAIIETDLEKFQRVYASVPKKISPHASEIIYRAWLSEDERVPGLIFHFLKVGFDMGARVCEYIQDPQVQAIVDLNRKVGGEAHRFLGLLRFQEITKGIFYAGYEPDHNITVLIAPHFTKRLACQPFLIHDKKRSICAVYDGQDLVFTPEIPELINERTKTEDEYSALWKAFFKQIAIQERKNLRTQMQFMPKKYWKNLTEMQG